MLLNSRDYSLPLFLSTACRCSCIILAQFDTISPQYTDVDSAARTLPQKRHPTASVPFLPNLSGVCASVQHCFSSLGSAVGCNHDQAGRVTDLVLASQSPCCVLHRTLSASRSRGFPRMSVTLHKTSCALMPCTACCGTFVNWSQLKHGFDFWCQA